jgi:AraC-like DNA-binding protein
MPERAQNRSALAVGAALTRPSSPAQRPRSCLEERRLHEAVRACGYDARRIAQYFGISVRHLQRWFSGHMGTTPGLWLAKSRLQEAQRLLTDSSSVKEVAYSLGFKHASQFSRDFRRQFGHQPSSELARLRLQTAPVAGTDTPQEREHNRRVELRCGSCGSCIGGGTRWGIT